MFSISGVVGKVIGAAARVMEAADYDNSRSKKELVRRKDPLGLGPIDKPSYLMKQGDQCIDSNARTTEIGRRAERKIKKLVH